MPQNDVIHIIALSGSLRAKSSNTELLRAAKRLAPSPVRVEIFERIGELPLFNPDCQDEFRDSAGSVRELDARVKKADGVLIACPEYARGVPGAFKNALDWLVGGEGFVSKPFAQFNASPRASHAQSSLRITLETMSGWPVEEAFIALPLLNRGLTADVIVSDESLAKPIKNALLAFSKAIASRRQEESG